jgi:hypothetical protein
LIYDELIHHIGEVKARVYYEANRDALTFIRNTVHENRISCDLVDEYAYIYTTSKQNIAKIDKEWNAYEKLGIPGKRTDRIPLPLDASTAIVMSNQARFHPVVYLTPMMNDFINNGGHIFEETTAMTVEHASPLSKVVTKDGYKVACRDVVSCSHFPFYGAGGFYFARMYAERSYALGVKSNMDYPGGMYLSADAPPRSIRYVSYHGEDLILVGGERHKTGQGICTFKHYEALEAFVGEQPDLEVPTIIAVLLGMVVGFAAGKPVSLMAAMDGMAAGIMGGMMGAMLGAMLLGPGWMVWVMDFIDIIMLITVFLLIREEEKLNEQWLSRQESTSE